LAPGPVWTGADNLAPTGIRSPDLPARSESLYRLGYPGHIFHYTVTQHNTDRCPLQKQHFVFSCILYVVYTKNLFFFMRLQRVKRVFSDGFVSRGRTGCDADVKNSEVLHSKIDSTGVIVIYRA
jgi:hypothetical protein